MKNIILAEPHLRQTNHMSDIFYKNSSSVEEQGKHIASLTYEQFKTMKTNWLKNICITWLIQGHLTKGDALQMVEIAESKLEFQ